MFTKKHCKIWPKKKNFYFNFNRNYNKKFTYIDKNKYSNLLI